jgi:hypothetical protein
MPLPYSSPYQRAISEDEIYTQEEMVHRPDCSITAHVSCTWPSPSSRYAVILVQAKLSNVAYGPSRKDFTLTMEPSGNQGKDETEVLMMAISLCRLISP